MKTFINSRHKHASKREETKQQWNERRMVEQWRQKKNKAEKQKWNDALHEHWTVNTNGTHTPRTHCCNVVTITSEIRRRNKWKRENCHVHTCKSEQHFNPINNGEVHTQSFHLSSAQHVKRELKCLNPLLSLSSSSGRRFTWFHFITISKGARAQQQWTSACVADWLTELYC